MEYKSELYFFNPGHEVAILNNSPYYMPPANVLTMHNNLAFLPAWIAGPSDFVFMNNELPQSFIEYLSENQLSLATALTQSRLNTVSTELCLHLWGISRSAIHYFNEIKKSHDLNLHIPQWNDQLKKLNSRYTARQYLVDLNESIDDIASDIIPVFYENIDSIEVHLNNAESKFLAKAPYSSSGRGLLWLPNELTRTERQILHGILKKQGSVSIEKVLDKKLDLAMEFRIENNGDVQFIGYSLFFTNNKGAYLGNYLKKQLEIENQISEFINLDLLDLVKAKLILKIKTDFSGIYSGCIGVDMMIYNDNGEYKLHPCLEINIRDNMGLLAINLSQNYLDPESQGFFYLDFSSKNGDLLDQDHSMKEKYPAVFRNGKIKTGYLSLCPINQETRYRAYILVSSNLM